MGLFKSNSTAGMRVVRVRVAMTAAYMLMYNRVGWGGIKWKTNIAALLFPLSKCHFVPWCQQRSTGLDLLTLAVLQPSTKASDVAHMIVANDTPPPPTNPPSLLPPVLQPLSKCHPANKTPVHTEPEQNTASSIHTETVKHSKQTLATFSKTRLSPFFLSSLFFSSLLSGAENFSPQIKEGIIENMAEIPTLIPILHACVCVCVKKCVCVICACRLWKTPLWSCQCA